MDDYNARSAKAVIDYSYHLVINNVRTVQQRSAAAQCSNDLIHIAVSMQCAPDAALFFCGEEAEECRKLTKQKAEDQMRQKARSKRCDYDKPVAVLTCQYSLGVSSRFTPPPSLPRSLPLYVGNGGRASQASDEVVAELPSIIAQGHRSLKVFMTYPHNRLDDEGLLKVLEVVSTM